jgi:hypothetical protein
MHASETSPREPCRFPRYATGRSGATLSVAGQKKRARSTDICGGGGIRTHGSLSTTPVFKTGALNRSATPPVLWRGGTWSIGRGASSGGVGLTVGARSRRGSHGSCAANQFTRSGGAVGRKGFRSAGSGGGDAGPGMPASSGQPAGGSSPSSGRASSWSGGAVFTG